MLFIFMTQAVYQEKIKTISLGREQAHIKKTSVCSAAKRQKNPNKPTSKTVVISTVPQSANP